MLTVQEFKDAIPKNMHSHVNQQFIDNINTVGVDSEVRNNFINNLIQYGDVLNDGKYKITDYLNAAMFVSFKMLGHGNTEAWKRTFKPKYQKMIASGTEETQISKYASAYNKGKLVQAIAERSLCMDHVLFADIRHKAIKRQADLMMSDNENVAQRAADSLMNHLKAPESVQANVKVDVQVDDTLLQLEQTLNQIAEKQVNMIGSGQTTAKSVAHQPLLMEHDDE